MATSVRTPSTTIAHLKQEVWLKFRFRPTLGELKAFVERCERQGMSDADDVEVKSPWSDDYGHHGGYLTAFRTIERDEKPAGPEIRSEA